MNASAPAQGSLIRVLVFSAVLGILLLLAWYAHERLSLVELAEQEERLRELIALYPWRAFGVGFGIYLALAFVPGTGGKAVVWGWLFGFWLALLTVSVGLTAAAMVIFALSRYLFQAAIERRYGHFLQSMNRHLDKEGAFYLLTLRMAHVPYSLVNPLSGASRVKTWTFFWTTVVGLLPANAIWIYVGMRLPSLRELAVHGPASLVDLRLFLALAACAAFPWLLRWLLKRSGFSGSLS